ncbi:ABC transporter transmembrane domain-containing protein [Buchnera aphidicola]|uniref:ABC transporter transmembrane domain-containing protein n=1 Tax=Buchnera aphidicola TaxID=9 RepID=UPI0031B84D38
MANLILGWPTLKRLLYYGKFWKKEIYTAFLILFFASILETIGPCLISYFINHIEKIKQVNKIYLLSVLSFYFISQTTSIILNYLQTILFNKIAIKIIQKIRIEVFTSLISKPLYFFNKTPIGDIISIITNDTEILKELYDTVLINIFKNISLIIIMLITMFFLQWKMAIIATTLFPIVIIIILFYQYFCIPKLRKIRSLLTKINHEFHEIINGIHIIQQFSQEKKFLQIIKKSNTSHYQLKINILKIDSLLLRPLINLISSVILCGLMSIFITTPINIIHIGTIYAFISYLNRINEPLIIITTQQTMLQQAIVSGERIFHLLDYPKQKYGNDNSNLITGKIQFKNLNFQYNQYSKKILSNINLTIPYQEFTAIIGETGSGKSTLVNLIMGHYIIQQGNLFIDNRKISTLSYQILKKNIYIVQQNPCILSGTILFNISLGKNVSEIEVWKVLKKIKLYNFVQSLENKIHTFLQSGYENLSIGQKQLISIARVLIIKPKILILDEFTSNIDPEIEDIIQKILIKIKKNSTIIIIAHKLSTIKYAKNIIILKDGKIIEQGGKKKLLNNRNSYYKKYLLE